jgi:hypothetical protein
MSRCRPSGSCLETPSGRDRSCLVAQRLPIPLRDVCGPYPDSAIWKVVTSPSRLSYRPPGPVLESRHGSLPLALRAGSGKLVRRGFSRAGRVKEPPGGFHQVDGLAAGTPEPPLEIASSRSRLRRLRVRLMEDRSLAVTTGLSSVIDLERLSPAAVRIAAAAPKRTEPPSSLHRVGAAHRTCDDAGLSLF